MKGLGYTGTHQLLNEYQFSRGMEPVAPTTACLTAQQLQPKADRTIYEERIVA